MAKKKTSIKRTRKAAADQTKALAFPLVILPSLVELPHKVLEAGAEACFNAFTREYGIENRTVIKPGKEPVPLVVPYQDQAEVHKLQWRRIAQATFKAMERAK
jgi:hypothetical protein